jgi:hypothetical protein
MARSGQYASDRWVTPGVIIAALVVLGIIIASIVLSVAYLTARGIDSDPLLRLVPALVAAATGLGTLVLQLANRTTSAKTERNTGILASAVAPVLAATPPASPAAAALPVVDDYAGDDYYPTEQQRLPVPQLPADLPAYPSRSARIAR